MKTLAVLLASVLLATFAHADTITTLDGHSYTGDIVPDGKYFLSVRSEDGTTSVGIAQLSATDLARLDSTDRSKDGRFWFERCLALAQAYQKGLDVKAASIDAGPYVALGKEWRSGFDQQQTTLLAKIRANPNDPQARNDYDANQRYLRYLAGLGYKPAAHAGT